MATKFLSGAEIWKSITSHSKKTSAGNSSVAVAYLGGGASEWLLLGEGDQLFVDMSEQSVKFGRTNPHEVLKFIKQGVDVYSVTQLHAKVYVFGKTAIIGSSNASSSSRNRLVEACVETTDPSVVAAAKNMIRGLSAARVGEKEAKMLAKLWSPQFEFDGTNFEKSRKRKATQKRLEQAWAVQRTGELAPVWVVPLGVGEDSPEETKARRTVEKETREKTSDRADLGKFDVESFGWTGQKFTKRDRVVMVVTEGKKKYVYPVGVVHSIKSVQGKKKECDMMIGLEMPKFSQKKLDVLEGKIRKRYARGDKVFLEENPKILYEMMRLFR